jgi:16S rRNA (uracil1498-N3)-methyltransferase
MDRFFIANLDAAFLSAAEAHHCRQVTRHQIGDTITVFDGRGHEAQCQITGFTAEGVELKILSRSATPPLRCRLLLAQAVPKRNMDLIVQKATELGVAEIYPLLSERTVVEATAKLDRWRAIALESCKQCGQNWLPVVHPPVKAAAFFAALPAADLKLIGSLQPDAQPLKSYLPVPPRPPVGSVLVLIGPEGDFTPAELAAAKSAGCLPLSLGPLVLRADTAAIYAVSILHHELQMG